ncbi:hypothetical protein [Gemelliphila palaticanis]|uniref:Uncharacterized protein n=1 Tax=Gemelliphila palaticanis TaxID=81950 RepID=A0ABX2T448_9BACL|nr:hypothetical protein [Gemella palaticanis]MBF0715856.1 hypothetical protein [Gemella palaticanis]NYS47786.1 hypothetical protein [Gemella palaticanis]
MNFKETKTIINNIIENDYENFVKALISIEKSIDNEEILDSVYEEFMRKDSVHLLNEDFDYIISKLTN